MGGNAKRLDRTVLIGRRGVVRTAGRNSGNRIADIHCTEIDEISEPQAFKPIHQDLFHGQGLPDRNNWHRFFDDGWIIRVRPFSFRGAVR